MHFMSLGDCLAREKMETMENLEQEENVYKRREERKIKIKTLPIQIGGSCKNIVAKMLHGRRQRVPDVMGGKQNDKNFKEINLCA